MIDQLDWVVILNIIFSTWWGKTYHQLLVEELRAYGHDLQASFVEGAAEGWS